jgi:hypothetical protein
MWVLVKTRGNLKWVPVKTTGNLKWVPVNTWVSTHKAQGATGIRRSEGFGWILLDPYQMLCCPAYAWKRKEKPFKDGKIKIREKVKITVNNFILLYNLSRNLPNTSSWHIDFLMFSELPVDKWASANRSRIRRSEGFGWILLDPYQMLCCPA